MLSPKKQQLQICLTKINFAEIEDKVRDLASGVASMSSHNEEQTKKIQEALTEVRLLNKEAERLNREGLTLTAKRLEIKRQCDELDIAIQDAVQINTNIKELMKQEDNSIQKQIAKYEEMLHEKVKRFKNGRFYYNNDEMKVKIQEANTLAETLMNEAVTSETCVENLQKEFEKLETKVPENILNILGKAELVKELDKVSEEYEELEKRVT